MPDVSVVKLLKRLMEIPSVSEEEHEIGVFLSKYLKDLNYNVELIPIAPESTRCNVYAYLGSTRKARACLTSHMDTVPPHIPFRIENNVIFGRGACDDKGPMAAQIVAVEELRAEGKLRDGDVSLLFVVGEEKGGPGMLAVNDMNLTWEAVIFGEPTEGKMAIGHKGHFVFELFVNGLACHSGYPERGRSANDVLTKLLVELQALPYPASELLGPSTFNCGKIQGGVAYNVLAAEAYALCGIRVAADVEKIQHQVAEAVKRYPDVTLKENFAYSETLLDYDVEGMFHLDHMAADEHADFVTGLESMPVSFGTDVPRLKGDHKKYLYGPGSILHAHGENEQVAIPDLLETVAVYKQLIMRTLESKV